ncbi:MAG: hypothetical protein HQL54_11195 [Magnetococcales bacterium]|nr:hypothetical protein [Magnetococcales bacterium]
MQSSKSSLMWLVTVLAMMLPALGYSLPWYGGTFSADIIMKSPKDPSMTAQGTLHVGQHQVRAEGTHGTQSKGVIIDFNKKKIWTILPNEKQFHKGLGNAPMPPRPDAEYLPSDPDSPCATGGEKIRCKKLASDKIDGMAVDQWQITLSNNNRSQQMMLWISPQRRVILRQQTENGPTMERRWGGYETLNGRKSEKWTLVQSFKDKSLTMTKWIDAKLYVPVRVMDEKGNITAELTNILEGSQPDHLFDIPSNYQEIAPPKPRQPKQQQHDSQQGQQFH